MSPPTSAIQIKVTNKLNLSSVKALLRNSQRGQNTEADVKRVVDSLISSFEVAIKKVEDTSW